MARLIIENLTIEQARELASWYDGQGEQDADIWFESQDPPIKTPMVDNSKRKKDDGETVTIYCR